MKVTDSVCVCMCGGGLNITKMYVQLMSYSFTPSHTPFFSWVWLIFPSTTVSKRLDEVHKDTCRCDRFFSPLFVVVHFLLMSNAQLIYFIRRGTQGNYVDSSDRPKRRYYYKQLLQTHHQRGISNMGDLTFCMLIWLLSVRVDEWLGT